MSSLFALSFVIPLYNSVETIGNVVSRIAALTVPGGHEVVLVNDGSSDGTREICEKLIATASVPITYIEHSRNFGEHNAVLTGYRHARGEHVISLDDDGQNPPEEALKLWQYAKDTGLDAVFGDYRSKQHEIWRNLGSWFSNRVADSLLDKPKGLYLSSFRCVSKLVAEEVASYSGPYPYIDGLILQISHRVGAITVEHRQRMTGASGYNLHRLVSLWLNSVVNFSVVPLRFAAILGGFTAVVGLAGIGVVSLLWFMHRGPVFGWGSLMAALLTFSGAQLLMLGIIGEYVGRAFLVVNGRPQSLVRTVLKSSNVDAIDVAKG
jgi:glycosyltransferase involved in cell wall biosynthesis